MKHQLCMKAGSSIGCCLPACLCHGPCHHQKHGVQPDLSIIGPSATRQFHFDESGRRCSSAGISHDQVQRTNWAQGDKWEQVQAAESPRSGDADDVVEVCIPSASHSSPNVAMCISSTTVVSLVPRMSVP